METIVLSDVVISATAARRMTSFDGWTMEQRIVDEEVAFYKDVWVDDEFTVYDRTLSFGAKHVRMRLITDFIYRMKSMFFYHPTSGEPEEIPQESELGQVLRAKLLDTFDRFGFLSFDRDIVKKHLSDFPEVCDYLRRACEDRYHVDPPEDVVVHFLPKDLWCTIRLDQGVEAAYMPMLDGIFTADKEYKSSRWRDSTIVHEFTHALQRRKDWLMSPRELGITDYEFEQIAKGIRAGKTLDEIAHDLNRSKSELLRAKGFIDDRIEYATKYYESPVEVNAWGEQFQFLKEQGVAPEKIETALFEYVANQGGVVAGTNKAQLHRMIWESDRMIAKAMDDLQALRDHELVITEE